MPESDAETISPQTASKILDVNPRTISRWADDGKLGPVTYTEGGQRRLQRVAVERFRDALAAERAS